jgi:hypothetical protein
VLDSLVDPLQKTINFKPKQDAVKQEVDRNEDMIRSALRAIASLNRIRLVFCALCESSYLFYSSPLLMHSKIIIVICLLKMFFPLHLCLYLKGVYLF